MEIITRYKNFKKFDNYDKYSEDYELYYFNFHKFDKESYLIVNDVGEFIFIKLNCLPRIINKRLDIFGEDKELFKELLNKQFLYLKRNKHSQEQKIIKYRTKKQFLYSGPVLHLFVVTTRCEHKCKYCQITPQSVNATQYDMTIETAKKSVDIMMKSPSSYLTVEFQGGETLLAFDVIEFIVLYVNKLNEIKNKDITFVIASSLVGITTEQLSFIKKHEINLSTSLDGPEELHNFNRPIHSQNTYKKFTEGFLKSKNILDNPPSPLLTISKKSLDYMESIINEYIKFDSNSISLRAISPYGFAAKTIKSIGYSADDYIDFYKKSLDYIININKEGKYFREDYTTLLLKRIFTPYSTGYVDLQSPSGAGINALAYYYNGEIYPADEARMLSEMGDKSFLLGNVHENTYADIYSSEQLEVLINDSCAESLNGCSDCTYLQYCGCDPLYNYVTQGDHYGHRPTSDFCKKQKAIFGYLFELIKKDDSITNNIFWSWINNNPTINPQIKEKDNCDSIIA